MSDRWEALDRKSIRAAEAKFGVQHPRHDEATLDDLCPNSGASKGVCGCVSCSDTTASERRILTDLLAELRDADRDQAMEESVIDLTELADTYERRLREVQGE